MNHPLAKHILENQLVVAILLILVTLFLLKIKGILIAIFISFIIMAAFLPYVEFLRKRGVPRVLSVFIPYVFALAIFLTIVVPLIPFFVSQIQSLFTTLPKYLGQVAGLLGMHIDPIQLRSFIGTEISELGKNAFTITSRFFGGLFSTLTIIFVSFYLLLDHDRIKKFIVSFFKQDHQERTSLTISHIEEKIGAWFRGQIFLSFFIGATTWIALSILGIEFALPLALLAGIFEIVPTIGPIIAAIPAVIIALNTSLNAALIVVLLYTVIQAIENNLLVPRVMQKAVGLHPVAIIISIIAGGELLGILGALLAIPFVSLLLIVYNSLKQNYGNS